MVPNRKIHHKSKLFKLEFHVVYNLSPTFQRSPAKRMLEEGTCYGSNSPKLEKNNWLQVGFGDRHIASILFHILSKEHWWNGPVMYPKIEMLLIFYAILDGSLTHLDSQNCDLSLWCCSAPLVDKSQLISVKFNSPTTAMVVSKSTLENHLCCCFNIMYLLLKLLTLSYIILL